MFTLTMLLACGPALPPETASGGPSELATDPATASLYIVPPAGGAPGDPAGD